MIDDAGVLTRRDSRSAAVLHALMQNATRNARLVGQSESKKRTRRRLAAGAPWALLPNLRASTGLVDRTLALDRAVRRVITSLLEESTESDAPVSVETVEGPVLIIRSAPWPVLRALLARLALGERVGPITVLCHRRDESTLTTLSSELGLQIESLLYPRFEPFNTSTLRRLLTGRQWRAAIVLDASRAGRGESLEHITTVLSPPDAYVWNAGGVAWQQKPLRDRLPPETYALLRGLLRWRARNEAA